MLKDLLNFIDSDNIAEDLDDDTLKKIAAEVVDGYDTDRNDRRPWEEKMKKAMDLALQNTKVKNFPWKNASNIMMPVLTEAIVQYNSRMYPALIPPVDIVKGRVVGFDPSGEKQNAAVRVSKHMSWQLLEQMEEWEDESDRGLIIQPLLGNMYKKTYRDHDLGRNVSEMLSPAEFVMCNNAKSVEKSFRKTHFFESTKNEIKIEQNLGNYRDVELLEPVIDSEKPESQRTSEVDDSTPYLLLEQHTWYDLDNDGLMEPYICTVDHKSRTVLKIVAGYTEKDILSSGKDILRVSQEQFFTKYGFIPNPDGSIMDLGLGQLLGPINKQINAMVNNLTDAGTAANTGGGLLGRGIKIKGGEIKRRMNQYTTVPTSGTDLARNVVHFPQIQPSAVLFNLLGLLMNSAQRIASTLDSQVGENPGQNQKATTTMAVQEEGKRIFSGIYKRCHRSLNKEFKRLYYLNATNMVGNEYLNVLDGVPMNERATLGEVIYKTDYDLESVNIVPAADSNYTPTQMKLAKANALVQKIPTGLVNPQVAMQRALEAEEQPGIEQIMDVPPPQPSFEMVKLQQEMNMKRAEMMLEVMNKEQEWINNEMLITSQAMLNLAKAESEEAGIQYQEYSQQLDTLREMARVNVERMKSAQSLKQPTQSAPESIQ